MVCCPSGATRDQFFARFGIPISKLDSFLVEKLSSFLGLIQLLGKIKTWYCSKQDCRRPWQILGNLGWEELLFIDRWHTVELGYNDHGFNFHGCNEFRDITKYFFSPGKGSSINIVGRVCEGLCDNSTNALVGKSLKVRSAINYPNLRDVIYVYPLGIVQG